MDYLVGRGRDGIGACHVAEATGAQVTPLCRFRYPFRNASSAPANAAGSSMQPSLVPGRQT